MQVINENDCDITMLASALTGGNTLIYPTETCYGLGCDATNQEAVNRLYEIKGRHEDKPLIALMSDIAMVKQYVAWSGILDSIASKHWPGALTIIVQAKKDCGLAAGVIAPDGTVAVRVSAHPFAHGLVAALGRPLVSTSANLAGGENLYDPKKIIETFEGRFTTPDVLIDGGVLPVNKPTTVVRVIDGRVEVVRQGRLVISDM